MARKKYMAIHTFNSDEMKKAFFRGLHKSELTDFEWRDGYIFENASVQAHGLAMMIFSFASGNLKMKKMY